MPPGMICSVAVCNSNSHVAKETGEIIRFFRFPKNQQLREVWVRKCHRNDKFDPEGKRICGKHFTNHDYEDGLKAKLMNEVPRKLKADCVPSLHLLSEETSEELVGPSTSKQAAIKQQRELVRDLLVRSYEEHNLETVRNLPSSSKETPYEVLLSNYQAVMKENEELKKTVLDNEALLQKKNLEVQELTKKFNSGFDTKIKELLSDFLTPNQLDIITKKKTKARWTTEEISKAFTIRYFSKRCYIYLRQTLKYPLPGISTLQRWAGKINLRRGVLKDVLTIMNTMGKSKDDIKRIVVLSFDEVKIYSTYEYDQKEDEVVGPHVYMQVIMARGLFDNWKQPIFIGFDKKVTKYLLEEVITHLHEINYNVVACVSDCGVSNVGLWRELEINVDKTFCFHPVTQEKIYFFADVPHILKLVRNWFIDTGFILEGGVIINKHPVQKLIERTNSEISSCHKLKFSHLTCEKAQRQNVLLAAQLFSHTTATALKRYFRGDELATNVADFIALVNSWFDVLNSYTPQASIPAKLPYGKNLEVQDEVLDKAKCTFSKMICTSKKSVQTFQEGLIISTSSLQGLYRNLVAKYKIKYILTHRLNQDCLENFFSQLRTKGGLHDHPAPLNALYRIRMILLGKNPGIVQTHSNTLNLSEAEREEYVLASALKKADINIQGTCEESDDHDLERREQVHLSVCSNSPASPSVSHLTKTETLAENDGLVYIAGYLAKKHKQEYPQLGNYTYQDCGTSNLNLNAMPSWVQHLSFGGLIQPSEEWSNSVTAMDKYFKQFHKEQFRSGKSIVQRTANFISKKVEGIPKPLIQSFSRQRLFMRIKYFNSQKGMLSRKRKAESDAGRKSAKKLKKIVL